MRIDIDLALLRPDSLNGSAAGLVVEAAGQPLAARAQDDAALVIAVGHPRPAGTDTELDAAALLARYRQLEMAALDGLHGRYAIAVVDAARQRVLLSCDRMSVHGWCYRIEGLKLSVSDRADRLGQPDEISAQAVFTYLFHHVIPSPDTIFAGVRRLPPAGKLIFNAAGAVVSNHWQPVFSENARPDFGSLREEFLGTVRASVAREWKTQGGADGSGSIATFLSGGTDSSTVSGMLRRVADRPLRAYSIGFNAHGYDEMDYARIAARHFGLDHREHYLTAEEVIDGIPKVATFYDQPFGNSSAVASYHCARIAREEGATRLLAGDGGDELFGGNSRYAKQRMFGWYDGVPASARRQLLEPLLAPGSAASKLPGLSKAASYVEQARVPMPDRLNMYNLLLRLGLGEVLTPGFLAAVTLDGALQGQREVYAASQGAHLVNRMLAYDWKFTLADNDLPKVSGTTALAGVGVSFPLLSDELIDFSLRLPVDYKLKGLKLRWFFKEALKGFLPTEIIEKKKQGFGLPFGVWALRHAALAKLADDAVAGFAARRVISEPFTRRLRLELLPSHPGYYGELVWIITMLEHWLRAHAPDYRFES